VCHGGLNFQHNCEQQLLLLHMVPYQHHCRLTNSQLSLLLSHNTRYLPLLLPVTGNSC
jgi:hypothetical protein